MQPGFRTPTASMPTSTRMLALRAAAGELERELHDELGAWPVPCGKRALLLHGFVICVHQERTARRTMWWARATEHGRVWRAEPLVVYRGECSEPWRALLRTVDGSYRSASFEQALERVREKWASWP